MGKRSLSKHTYCLQMLLSTISGGQIPIPPTKTITTLHRENNHRQVQHGET